MVPIFLLMFVVFIPWNITAMEDSDPNYQHLENRMERLEESTTQQFNDIKQQINTLQPNLIQSNHNVITDGTNHDLWSLCAKEMIQMNHPITAAVITLAFYALRSKERIDQIPQLSEKTKRLLPYIIERTVWANIINSITPYFHKNIRARNGWAYMGFYLATDVAATYATPLLKKMVTQKIPNRLRKQLKRLPKSVRTGIDYIPWFIKALTAYVLTPAV